MVWSFIVPVTTLLIIGPSAQQCIVSGACTELFASTAVAILSFIGSTAVLLSIFLHVFLRRFLSKRVVELIVPQRVAEFCAAFFMWNTYTIFYALYSVPWSLRLFWISSATFAGSLAHYLAFVTLIPSPVVMVTAMWKIAIGRMRVEGGWSWKHQAIIGSIFAPISASALYYYYAYQPLDFPLFLAHTLFHYAYVCTTTLGMPEVTGRRAWPAFRGFFKPVVDLVLSYLSMRIIFDGDEHGEARAYAGGEDVGVRHRRSSVKVLNDTFQRGGNPMHVPSEKLQGGQPCIIGFHPHGIIPYSSGLAVLHKDFCAHFPGVHPCFLTDAFTHLCPGLRDVLQWLGTREVSREGLSRALKEGLCCSMVPGGQREIFTSRSHGSIVWMSRRNKGFIRYALRHGAALIPAVTLGEWMIMDLFLSNSAPWILESTRRMFGFPFPFVPVGPRHMPNMPRRAHLTTVFGAPLRPRPLKKPGHPTEEEVDAVHRQYFGRIEEMFNRHKKHSGFGDWTLQWLEGEEVKRG